MGLGSEIDTYLKKQKEVGLTSGELKEFKRLYEHYYCLNELFGMRIRSFEEMQKEVMLFEKDTKLKGS